MSFDELASALAQRERRLEACILFADWSGDRAALLTEQVQVTVGALYPISDTWAALYVLLMHRAWARRQDLKVALAEVRARLRSGRWGDSEAEIGEIVEQYAQATAHLSSPRPGQRSPSEQMRRRGLNLEGRWSLYHGTDDNSRALRMIAETVIIYG